jgi:hypothetical protein
MKKMLRYMFGAFRIETPIPFGSGTHASGRKVEQILQTCMAAVDPLSNEGPASRGILLSGQGSVAE